MKARLLVAIAGALLLSGCGSDDAAGAGGASYSYSNRSDGPLTIKLEAPGRDKSERVFWIEFEADTPSTVLVDATYRLGVRGEGHIVRTYLFRGNKAVPVGLSEEHSTKIDNAYEERRIATVFDQGAGTFQAGLAVKIEGNGYTDVDAIFRDVSIEIEIQPRSL